MIFVTTFCPNREMEIKRIFSLFSYSTSNYVLSLITTKMPACSHCVSCHRDFFKDKVKTLHSFVNNKQNKNKMALL